MHQGPLPRLELATRGQVMLSGDWQIELRAGGVELPIAGPWTCSCWYSEEEGDYLELQAQPTPEIRIERQLLLSRTDDLLLMADAVIGSDELRIDYTSRLPLVPELEVIPFSGTRECRVTGPAGQARLFPLGLAVRSRYRNGGSICRVKRPARTATIGHRRVVCTNCARLESEPSPQSGPLAFPDRGAERGCGPPSIGGGMPFADRERAMVHLSEPGPHS